MEINEFAEQILFGNRLEDKLQRINSIEDTKQYKPIETPNGPVRPNELMFSSKKEKFPTIHQIESDVLAKGKVLHFFANHELLALELMALVLLKFPDAPKSFRKGLVHTMMEEQDHMGLYLEGMSRFGVGFGELGVSDFFWKTISNMNSPFDFVTRMSLTFEQANLDFALYYKTIFEKIGDTDTARDLNIVYEDEIRHVQHGLQWFREWKDQRLSDWDAYESSLTFPLTPARAKAMDYSISSRKKAGFDQTFIDKLHVYNHSKGKTPDVYVFNVACEQEILSGIDHYQPTKMVKKLEKDLSIIPFILSGKDDIALVQKTPSNQFYKRLSEHFELPQFIEYKNSYSDTSLSERKLNELRPWGWSPVQKQKFGSLINNTTSKFKEHPNSIWKESYNTIFSKATSLKLLNIFIEQNRDDFLISSEETGKLLSRLSDILFYISELNDLGYKQIVVKSCIGSSGHNLKVLDSSKPLGKSVEWIQSILESQGEIIVEPWLEKYFDFSMQYRVDVDHSLHQLGFARFDTDHKGQYIKSHVGHFDNGLNQEFVRFLRHKENKSSEQRIVKLYNTLTSMLTQSEYVKNYVGHFGVDAIVYKSIDGQLKIRPIVEVNSRFTMGHIALKLTKKVVSNSYGYWKILKRKDIDTSFKEFDEMMRHKYPVVKDSQGKIQSGYIATNEPNRADYFLSYLLIDNGRLV